MNLSLRAKLRLPAGCSNTELQDACNRYYAIYQHMLDSSTDESVKAIARSKLDDLIASMRQENITADAMGCYSFSSGASNTSAAVEAELAKSGESISDTQAKKLNDMIASLPDSPKRYYLSALVMLRSGNKTVDNYRNALSRLKNAVSSDPQNPVYLALVNEIEREIANYQNAYALHLEEERKAAEREKTKSTIVSIFKAIGTGLLWIGGAALTVAGALLSCWCSSCEACS